MGDDRGARQLTDVVSMALAQVIGDVMFSLEDLTKEPAIAAIALQKMRTMTDSGYNLLKLIPSVFGNALSNPCRGR